MKHVFLSAFKQNKSWLGLTFVFILSFFSGYSNPSLSKTPVKVQTEWVVSTKEVKTNDHSNKRRPAQFVQTPYTPCSILFSELYQNKLSAIKYKDNPGISLVQIISILSSRNLPQSKEEDSYTS